MSTNIDTQAVYHLNHALSAAIYQQGLLAPVVQRMRDTGVQTSELRKPEVTIRLHGETWTVPHDSSLIELAVVMEHQRLTREVALLEARLRAAVNPDTPDRKEVTP